VAAARGTRPINPLATQQMAYATKNGSAEQVAEAVAATFQELGAQVTLLPARKARRAVGGYDLVVLGAPLYSGRWHPDAGGFSGTIAVNWRRCR